MTEFRKHVFKSCTPQVPASAESSVHYKFQTLHSRDADKQNTWRGGGLQHMSDPPTPKGKTCTRLPSATSRSDYIDI